jgi:hypothetical protein
MSLSEVETLQLIALLSTRIAAVKQTIEGLDDQRLRLQNELNALTMAQEAVQHSILGSVQKHVMEVKEGMPPVKKAIDSPARKVPTKKAAVPRNPIPDSSSSDDDDVQPQRRVAAAPVARPSTSDAEVEQVEAATKEMDALREAILKACGVNGDLPPKATAAGSSPSKKHVDPSREGSDSSFDDEVEEVRRLK